VLAMRNVLSYCNCIAANKEGYKMNVKLVKLVKLIAHGIQDDVAYATLTNGKVNVTCEDALHFELDTQDDLDAAFAEWSELADTGEQGYSMEDSNT
jgi:hypothetical protein